jgi:hypothetical protein
MSGGEAGASDRTWVKAPAQSMGSNELPAATKTLSTATVLTTVVRSLTVASPRFRMTSET